MGLFIYIYIYIYIWDYSQSTFLPSAQKAKMTSHWKDACLDSQSVYHRGQQGIPEL